MAGRKVKLDGRAPPVGLLFGTAGVPPSAAASDSVSGVEAVSRLGLGAMEMEFVHGVRISDELAERVRARASELGIKLTCHGPYYINLNAKEVAKREASIKRVLDTARAAHKVGASSITFHAAFYMKDDPAKVHEVVRTSLLGILDTLTGEGIDVQIRPELTGKPSQYGDLEELLALASEIDGVWPCIDFSHYHARSGGGMNTFEKFDALLQRYGQVLGLEALEDMHVHISGIEYTPRGEKKHLQLKESDMNYRDLLRAMKGRGVGGVVICESPDTETDALLMKRSFARLKA